MNEQTKKKNQTCKYREQTDGCQSGGWAKWVKRVGDTGFQLWNE